MRSGRHDFISYDFDVVTRDISFSRGVDHPPVGDVYYLNFYMMKYATRDIKYINASFSSDAPALFISPRVTIRYE